MSLNKVFLIGNLGADPELRHTTGGIAVCTISVATTDKRKDNDGNMQEKTEWHRVNCWKHIAENVCKYLKKGSQVYVEGKLETRKWEKDGVDRYSTEITGFTVQFLDSKSDSQGRSNNQGPLQDQGAPSGPASLDDIPF